MGTGLAIGLGLGQAAAGITNSIIQGEYNKQIQDKANEFTREQSKNQIKYNYQQMKDLGLSPMMLFDHGNATGGSAGGGKIGASAPNYGAGIIEGINTIGKLWIEDKRRDLEEKKLDTLERKIDLEENKLNNQIKPTQNYKNREYTKKDINNSFNNLDNIII